jgi:hypothetical protein
MFGDLTDRQLWALEDALFGWSVEARRALGAEHEMSQELHQLWEEAHRSLGGRY